MERKSSYMYGSAAPKLPEREEKSFSSQKVQRKPVKAQSASSSIPKSKIVFCIMFVVAVSFIILYRYSAISELNYSMGNLTEEYNQLMDENRKLEVEIATNINLDRVKEIAETQLNMHKPESFQVVAVSVPKNNYSVVVDQAYIDQTTQSASLIEKVLGAMKAIMP